MEGEPRWCYARSSGALGNFDGVHLATRRSEAGRRGRAAEGYEGRCCDLPSDIHGLIGVVIRTKMLTPVELRSEMYSIMGPIRCG